MGQGLYTKMVQIASQELGVPVDAVFTQDTTSYQTANASPTAASSGSDLNGMAVKDACDQLNERLKPIREQFGKDAPMKTIAHAAYLARINLNAHGYWSMPKVTSSPNLLGDKQLTAQRSATNGATTTSQLSNPCTTTSLKESHAARSNWTV